MKIDAYAVIMICGAIDGFGHNSVFAAEIDSALAEFNIAARIIDYRLDFGKIRESLEDDNCLFFICFNGFGSELSLAGSQPGDFYSAFQYFNKNIFDLMHDLPTHEAMSHQAKIRFPRRYLLSTDFGYVQEAHELDIHNVRYTPSITFPRTQAQMRTKGKQDRSKFRRRGIQWLLPVQLPPPSSVRQRLASARSYRGAILKQIFESVSEACISDLKLDLRVETRRACREIGLLFDAFNPDHRFLMTAIADLVKFERRRRLLEGLKGLPITVLTSDISGERSGGFDYLPARTFKELLALMMESEAVICPLPHHTGFHERAMGAFSGGAAVLAAPNAVLESEFVDGRDFLSYQSIGELVELIGRFSEDPEALHAIAESGRERAHARFSPNRLVEVIVSLAQVYRK